MAQMNMKEAIRDAMRVELSRDPNVVIFGEDVGNVGGVFRVTEGLQKEFGEERVFDTPLAESAIGGMAVGLVFKASVRSPKFNSLVLFLRHWIKSWFRLRVCVIVPADVTIRLSYSARHLAAA